MTDENISPARHPMPSPVERKAHLIMGGLIIFGTLLSYVAQIFLWLLIILGVVTIYTGLTGNCMIRKTLNRLNSNSINPL